MARRSVEENPIGAGFLEDVIWGGGASCEELLFYDTETTGLSGGAGNVIFLIGLAWIEAGSLHFEQIFLADYPGEPDFLSHIERRLTPDRLFVSFNGKGFDSHLLRTRYLMNGRELRIPRQLDLLHIARRLWRRITVDCSLSTLERDILGIERGADVPGAEIPELYFTYLGTGDAGILDSVFTHNRQDVLSLAKLLAQIEALVTEKKRTVSVDLSGLGGFLLSRGDQRGLEHLKEALGEGDPRAGRILGHFYKRRGRWSEALAVWESMAERQSLYALIELAKYYEHRAKDPQRALDLVRRIEPWQARSETVALELVKRCKRLEEKVGRSEARRDRKSP
jgi:hypothetical protein